VSRPSLAAVSGLLLLRSKSEDPSRSQPASQSPPQSPENAARAGDCPDLGRLAHDTPFAQRSA
jgi:hypothetical protein